MILEESGMEQLGDELAQADNTEGELGLRSAIGLAGEYSPADRTEMQLSSLDDTAGGLDIPSSAEGSVIDRKLFAFFSKGVVATSFFS